MSNRRQQLLSQLKNNLDIVSRAIGLDKSKPSSTERPGEPARFESEPSSSVTSFNAKDQDFSGCDTDMRVQGPNRAPLFPTDHYSRNAAPNNGSAGIRDDIHEYRPSYDDQYSMHPERTTLFPTSTNDIDSEDAFLYGSRLPEPNAHMQTSSYSGNNSRQGASDDFMEKITYLLHGSSASTKKLPVTSEEMQVDQFSHQDYPKISVAGDMYNAAKRTDYHPAQSQDSDETVDRILKTIGLDGRISDMVQGLIRKDPRSSWPSQASTQLTFTQPMDAKSTPNQMPPITTNSSSQQMNWDRATQQFLNKMSHASTGEMPRGHEFPFASPYPPPPNWNNQKETKLPDSSGGLETRLYFKAKPEGTALPGLSYRQNDSSAARTALNETLSNIKALEEALAGLNQSKTSLMLRPPGSQRDSMMLENMRMQEELSGQILALRDTARDLSQQMKNQTSASSSSIQQSDSLIKNSPVTLPSQPSEEPHRELSTSKHSDRTSTDKKSRSRSHSRDKKKHRSRSRSRDRNRTRSRRYSRSRDGYRRRNRNRSRSRDRSRSRERRRSRDRMLSDADRKALGFGTPARKSLAQKAEDKEKKALEMALSMYVGASEYYNGTNIWCQKCDVIFNDVFGLCQHLHSEMHQSKVDPDYNKPRPPYVPVIPPGVPSAPSRGYEFILPLQAFFCSLCCEFSKDINKAEEHVKSVEHNKKFKQFVNDNSGYELKFLKDVMMAIARAKVAEEPQVTESKPDAEVTDTKKYSNAFLNPEDDSKRETREKFQIKFTGALKQGSSKVVSTSPDVEVTKVELSSNKNTSEDTKKTSASTSASSNVIVSKMIGLAKKPLGKPELSRPPGWVLRADAQVKPAASSFPKNPAVSPASSSAKNSLQNDKPKGPTLDIFSPDSPNTPFSKFPPLPTGGKSIGGRLQATSMTTTTISTGSAKKSEEAVLNIGDFEIFDEC